jgi:hypothetical protein
MDDLDLVDYEVGPTSLGSAFMSHQDVLDLWKPTQHLRDIQNAVNQQMSLVLASTNGGHASIKPTKDRFRPLWSSKRDPYNLLENKPVFIPVNVSSSSVLHNTSPGSAAGFPFHDQIAKNKQGEAEGFSAESNDKGKGENISSYSPASQVAKGPIEPRVGGSNVEMDLQTSLKKRWKKCVRVKAKMVKTVKGLDVCMEEVEGLMEKSLVGSFMGKTVSGHP